MSATMPARDPRVMPQRRKAVQLPVVLWLTVVWVAMWGDLSTANVLSGVALGTLVLLVFPLPRLPLHVRVRPLRLAWLVLHFLGNVVVASVQVSRSTLRFRQQLRNAVIQVDLRTPSDFVLTVVAEMTSLVPGSIVVEARRASHTLFLHVLDAGDIAGAERMRRQTLALERRVVLALGSQIDQFEPPKPATGQETGG